VAEDSRARGTWQPCRHRAASFTGFIVRPGPHGGGRRHVEQDQLRVPSTRTLVPDCGFVVAALGTGDRLIRCRHRADEVESPTSSTMSAKR